MFPLRFNDRGGNRERDRKSASSKSKPNHRRDKPKEQDKEDDSSQDRTSRRSTKVRNGAISTGHSSTTSTATSRSSSGQRRSSMPGLSSAGRPATASFLESRTSLPYPTFSKAHSKEVIGNPSILTPDPTDLPDARHGKSDSPKKEKSNTNGLRTENNHQAPPSPPLTSVDQQPPNKDAMTGEKDGKMAEEKQRDGKSKIRTVAGSVKSSSSVRAKKDSGSGIKALNKLVRPETPVKSRVPKEANSPTRTTCQKSPQSRTMDKVKLPRKSGSHVTMSPSRSSVSIGDVASESTNDSDATSIAPNQHQTYQKPMESPKKPPSRTQVRSILSNRLASADASPVKETFSYETSPMAQTGFGPPPPPPPPPDVPLSIPRVDYLLRNGGLDDRIPKSLLAGGGIYSTSSHTLQPQVAAARVFEPFNRLLNDYDNVMNKNGSLAVATGYRSVARRLLDRLEAVFARDISCESCDCLMCEDEPPEEKSASGVSWGEVLELVSGRRDLPNWPPFSIAPSVAAQVLSTAEHIPMQKLDVDIPEEYREHYIRQSRKTKLAVDKWLSEQTAQNTSPPDEIDDETLTFAMLTHLESEKRSLFCALLGIASSTPVPRPDLQQPRSRPLALASSALAIQRLYRLPSPPRDPETAIYMLNNPSIHHVLATLAAISNDEWDILVSGRFDGFLRSGAEDGVVGPASGSASARWTSRSSTPFPASAISRGTTPSQVDGSFRPASQLYGPGSSPASFGGPIALDEETEIATLAEIEREIYLSMEALEDAFEALHCKAEAVRRALRERGAGLSVANQVRRGSFVEARLGTPSSNLGQWESSNTEEDWIDDDRSLAPDDSASNISSNRRRRPKRRSERRTPAAVEEESEGDDCSPQGGRRERDARGSRRR